MYVHKIVIFYGVKQEFLENCLLFLSLRTRDILYLVCEEKFTIGFPIIHLMFVSFFYII